MNVLPLQCRNIIPTPFLSSNKASLERPGFQWTVSAYILSNHISMFSFCWPARDASLSPPPPILPSQEKFTADENTAFPKVTLQCLCSAVAMGYQPCSKHHLFRNVLRTQRGEGGRERDDRLVVNPACAGRTMFSPYTDSLFLVHLRRASIQYLFFRCVEYNVACFCNFALLEVILHYPNSNKTMCMTCLDVFGVSKYL